MVSQSRSARWTRPKASDQTKDCAPASSSATRATPPTDVTRLVPDVERSDLDRVVGPDVRRVHETGAKVPLICSEPGVGELVGRHHAVEIEDDRSVVATGQHPAPTDDYGGPVGSAPRSEVESANGSSPGGVHALEGPLVDHPPEPRAASTAVSAQSAGSRLNRSRRVSPPRFASARRCRRATPVLAALGPGFTGRRHGSESRPRAVATWGVRPPRQAPAGPPPRPRPFRSARPGVARSREATPRSAGTTSGRWRALRVRD